jgi:lysophospholipase L1-like esterase
VSSPKWSYPYLLEKELWDRGYKNVTVVNAGAEGWTSYETLINFQLRVSELDPDVVIVYHAANDIMARFVYPPAYFKGDNSGNRGPNVSDVVMPAVWEHSTVLRIAGISGGWTYPHAHLARTLVQALPTDVSHIWAQQVMDGVYPEGIFAEMSVRELFAANPPTYFRRNLLSLIASARLQGTETVLATFAYTPEKNASPFGNDPDFVWTYEEANELLRELATTEEGAHLYDFAAAFPRDPKWWADELHLNHDGAELKAKMFADYLEASGLLPQ